MKSPAGAHDVNPREADASSATRAMTRREVLALPLAGGIAGVLSGARPTLAHHAGRRAWGVQLYTVRDQIARDAEATLRAIAAIGYREVEALQAGLSTVAAIAKAHGLATVSVHLDPAVVLGFGDSGGDAAERLAGVSEEARRAGAAYLVMAWVPPAERAGGEPTWRRLAERLGRAGEQVAKAGLQLCYHNHAFELESFGGRTALDILVEDTNPALVKLELDVFWVGITGADPAALIGKYGARVALLHLKDTARQATSIEPQGSPPREAFVEVGNGSLDFPAILAAAGKAGVQHYFVEQDHTPGDPIASLRQSYEHLTRLAG
jgi:sugar phosphate isomerase/epimerase